MLNRVCYAWSLLVLLVFGGEAPAAEPLSDEELQPYVRPLVEGGWCRGMLVVQVTPEGTSVSGFGSLSASDPRAPEGSTIFEIGSVTKALTGLLLASLVERGELSLDTPVATLLPEDVPLASLGEKPVTLRHLATHSAGLPPLPANLAPANIADPYAGYTVEQLYEFLRSWKPASAEPRYRYSNLGGGLLGHVLARHAGKSYEELLVERVSDPLEMPDTRIALDEDQRTRFAPGHDADGEPAAEWNLPTLAGAGAVRSTGDDLAKLVAAMVGLSKTPLEPAARLSIERHLAVDPRLAIGLLWHLDPQAGTVMHNGQTGGYHAYIGMDPERRSGVVVLANTASMEVDEVGEALLARLQGKPAGPPRLRTIVAVEPDVLERYVGTYQLVPGFALVVTREKDRLYCQPTGQAKARIYPDPDGRFFWKAAPAEVSFDTAAEGPASALTLHQYGQNLTGVRVEETPAAADKAPAPQ